MPSDGRTHTMSLNIKNERVHELTRQVARRTGRSQTSAIETALERYLAELDRVEGRQARQHRIDELVAEMRARWKASDAPTFDAEDLYDENGLPA